MNNSDTIDSIRKITNADELTVAQEKFHSFRYGTEKVSIKKGNEYIEKLRDELSRYLNAHPEHVALYDQNQKRIAG